MTYQRFVKCWSCKYDDNYVTIPTGITVQTYIERGLSCCGNCGSDLNQEVEV